MQFDIRQLKWLLTRDPERAPDLDAVAATGFGPLEQDEFDSLLADLGIQVSVLDEATEVLVVGRDGWARKQITEVLDGRSGQHLRIYSQEMFFAYLVSGEDPLNDEEGDIRDLWGDHAALQFLEQVGFKWPTTEVGDRGSGTIHLDLEVGYLKYCGYTVGKYGLPVHERRRLLEKSAYFGDVPGVFPASYMGEWGRPGSAMRLQKMAGTIANLCKNSKKRRNPAYRRAIEEWEADLSWLKKTFYDGRYIFSWPSTEVW